MNENQKPFVCMHIECGMAFTNEDHLEVHLKKHKMALSLGIDNQANSTTDQTPTPTRFIRNCEEVGLFQDLQHVNPFDETFRKATELVKTGSLPVPSTSTDDTLHTPHFSPSIESLAVNKFSSNSCDITMHQDENELHFSESLTEIEVKPVADILEVIIDVSDDDITDLYSTKNSIKDSKIIRQNSHTKLITSKKKKIPSKPTLQRASLLEQQNRSGNSEDLKIEPVVTSVITKEVETNSNLKETNSSPAVMLKLKKKRRNSGLVTAQAQLQHQREVNRISQCRSRKKKKSWIFQLEQDVKHLREAKEKCLIENENLKRENNLLNSVLKYHQNCSVSTNPKIAEEINKLITDTRDCNKKISQQQTFTKKVVPIVPNPSQLFAITPITNAVLVPININEHHKALQSLNLTNSTSSNSVNVNTGMVTNLLVNVDSKNLLVPKISDKKSKAVNLKNSCKKSKK